MRANGVLRAQAGFETQQVLSAPLTSNRMTRRAQRRKRLYRALTNRLEEMPAIASIAYANEVRQSDMEDSRPRVGVPRRLRAPLTVGFHRHSRSRCLKDANSPD